MKKLSKVMLIILAICSVSVVSLSCTSASDSAVTENQTVTVQRGDLRVDITAVGNLSLSLVKELAFEISGTVEEVLVEEGDSVEEGQVLAKLDTSELQDEDEITDLERNVLQAEINLENVKLALDLAEEVVYTARAGASAYEIYVVAPWEVRVNEMRLELAELQLQDAEEALEEELEEALNINPEIIASFDGFVTKVNVEGGDEVTKGTVAVQLADPAKFEADILVSEMDIFDVELGREAWVSVDALDGLSIPAQVTHISRTATISSGVVKYEVKVEVESLETYLQEQRERMQEAMPDISSEELPEHLQQAIDEGSITQEEAEEMMERMQQAQAGQQGQVPTAIPENFQLREGLTVTVSIVVDEAVDALLVPNSAILQRGMETYVQVVSADGVIEERVITTGISDWQYTEVIDGLSEGEQVVVPQGTTTPTTPQQEQGPPGGMFPGMGGHPQ